MQFREPDFGRTPSSLGVDPARCGARGRAALSVGVAGRVRLRAGAQAGPGLAHHPEREPLRLSSSQQADIRAALDAMVDARAGELPPGLERLRAACTAISA
jgi:hypothetical protein